MVGELGVAPEVGWSEGLGWSMKKEDRVKALPGGCKRGLGK